MRRVQLGTALRAYTTPAEFPALFRHNLEVVRTAGERPAVLALADALADAGGVERDDVLIDLERWLLVAHEYYPDQLRRRRGLAALALAALIALAAKSLPRARRVEHADVLVDDWDPGSAGTFYGADVLSALGTPHLVDVTAFRAVDARDLAQLAPRWPHLARLARRVSREEGIGFERYLLRFGAAVLGGKALRRRTQARTVVSGNDNGFPTLLARAAGLRVVLIQNGLRGLLSDSAFVSADVLLALGAEPLQEVRRATGCRFGTVIELGGLRLAHHLRAGGAPDPPTFDVLFVSSLEPAAPFDARHGHYYPMSAEHRAIRLYAALAQSTDLRLAYYPRMDAESDELQRLGISLEGIDLLDRRPRGVYAAMQQARVVLSSISTATVEALAMNTPAGFVNLSGNPAILEPFATAGLECTADDADELARFVEHLATTPTTGLVNQAADPAAVVARAACG